MSYRYGDATLFPLEDNFLDTLVAAVDACVVLMEADAAAESRRARFTALEAELDDENRRLSMLERAVLAAVEPMVPNTPKLGRPYQDAARRIGDGAKGTLRSTRAALQRRREQARAELEEARRDPRIVESVGRFLETHVLPQTNWTLAWRCEPETIPGDGGVADPIVIGKAPPPVARATATSSSACGLSAEYELQLPEGLWRHPVPVGQLEPALALDVEIRSWMSKRAKLRRRPLSKYVVTSVLLTGDRAEVVLRAPGKRPGAGFRIIMRSRDNDGPVVEPMGADGRIAGALIAPEGEALAALERMWERIESTLFTMHETRRLTTACLGNADIQLSPAAAAIARAIMGTLSPLIHEMRARSGVPGELILKRDLGDGRREELFVSRMAIERRFARLPSPQRLLFEESGLGGSHDEPRAMSEDETNVDPDVLSVRSA